MKYFFIFLFLFFFIEVNAQADSTIIKKANTRKYSITEFSKKTSPSTPPLFAAFTGIGFRQSRLAYNIVANEARLDIIKTRPFPGFFKRIGIYVESYFKNFGKSPFMSMALLFPIFLLIVLPIIITLFIKIFIIKPRLDNPERPENDTINDVEEEDGEDGDFEENDEDVDNEEDNN